MIHKKHLNPTFITKILVIFVIILSISVVYLLVNRQDAVDVPATVDQIQTEYVKPETPVDRSKVVSLSGWSTMNVQAGTTNLTTGIYLNNPETNLFYEDSIIVDGKEVEKLVVDSGESVDLNHYLKLADIKSVVASVNDYDEALFNISNVEGTYSLEAISPFDEEQFISIKTDDGKKHTISVKCSQDYYYLKYQLYLGNINDEENAELLYESDLIEPGKCIQNIKISRALDAGTYEAFALIQPYASDRTTKLNRGTVSFTLNAT